jgi:hypothetical protein
MEAKPTQLLRVRAWPQFIGLAKLSIVNSCGKLGMTAGVAWRPDVNRAVSTSQNYSRIN